MLGEESQAQRPPNHRTMDAKDQMATNTYRAGAAMKLEGELGTSLEGCRGPWKVFQQEAPCLCGL